MKYEDTPLVPVDGMARRVDLAGLEGWVSRNQVARHPLTLLHKSEQHMSLPVCIASREQHMSLPVCIASREQHMRSR